MVRSSSLGLSGDFESSDGGSYLLEPASGEAKGVVHFLGGAFVGAGSQLTYRYLLEKFAEDGYLVVATPFRLSFDYLAVCDAVEASYDLARAEAAALGYGPELEVVSCGHSCGALLQALIATRRPAERRRLALISYNNKGASSAIPLFEEVVTPVVTEVMGDRLPTNPLFRQMFSTLRGAAEEALDAIESEDGANPFMKLRAAAPPEVRDFGDALAREGSVVARQGLELADQVPDLLGEIAAGAREFMPTPAETRELLRESFRADDVLVVQFDSDDIDESDEIYSVLRDAATNKAKDRGSVELAPTSDGSWASTDSLYSAGSPRATSPQSAIAGPSDEPLVVRLARAKGTHLTPLTQDIFLPAEKAADLGATRGRVDPLIKTPRDTWLRNVDDTYAELRAWLAAR